MTAATAGVPSVPPSGPFLYESAPISIPRSGPLTVHPNITVTPGTQYAVFFESSFTNLSTGIATGAYSGGDVVAYEAPNWSSIPPFDIALHADFTSTPPNPPPPTPVTPVTPASPATPAAPVTCPSLKRKLGRLQAKLAKQLTGVDDSAKKARKRAKIRKNIADTKKRMRKRRC